jgi:hypothetical protein
VQPELFQKSRRVVDTRADIIYHCLFDMAGAGTLTVDKPPAGKATAAITFDSLNPLGRRVTKNSHALALIIGVDSYENTSARAIYAFNRLRVPTKSQ